MKGSFMLVGIILIYLVIGAIAVETGLVEPQIDVQSFAPESPADGGSFWDKLSAVLAPLAWAYNSVAALLTLAAYSGEGIPAAVNTLIIAPLGLVLVFTVIKLVRGTGG